MKNIFLFVLVFCFHISSKGQSNSDCYFLFSDDSSGVELYGYRDSEGEIIIEPMYRYGYSESFCNMAIVLNQRYEWIGINGQNQVVLFPFIYDNGPDYVEDGLFRFVEDGMIGFANLDGHKLIHAQFSFVFPFSDGYAKYFIGGERIDAKGRTREQVIAESGMEGLFDLHWTWGGNISETGYIDKKGVRFDSIPSGL